MLMPLDRDSLKKAFAAAHPFPFVKIENFLDPNAAKEIAAAYPSFGACPRPNVPSGQREKEGSNYRCDKISCRDLTFERRFGVFPISIRSIAHHRNSKPARRRGTGRGWHAYHRPGRPPGCSCRFQLHRTTQTAPSSQFATLS